MKSKYAYLFLLITIFFLFSCTKSDEKKVRLKFGNQINAQNLVESPNKFVKNRTYNDGIGAKFKLNLTNPEQIKQAIFDLCVYRFLKSPFFNNKPIEFVDVEYKHSIHNFSIKNSIQKKDVFIIATIKHDSWQGDNIKAFIFLEKLSENYYGNIGVIVTSAQSALSYKLIDINRDSISEIQVITGYSGDKELAIYKKISGSFRIIFNEKIYLNNPVNTHYNNILKFKFNKTGYAEISFLVRIYTFK